uniref:Uncharacterized protein n=1 Tax=Anguilla anguilla TaxID=7936 RepID=A0A0E9XIF5_ANGAN
MCHTHSASIELFLKCDFFMCPQIRLFDWLGPQYSGKIVIRNIVMCLTLRCFQYFSSIRSVQTAVGIRRRPVTRFHWQTLCSHVRVLV